LRPQLETANSQLEAANHQLSEALQEKANFVSTMMSIKIEFLTVF